MRGRWGGGHASESRGWRGGGRQLMSSSLSLIIMSKDDNTSVRLNLNTTKEI